MRTFCTIITADYFPFAKALHTSLQRKKGIMQLQVLVVDKNINADEPGITIHTIESIENTPSLKEIERKYTHTNNLNNYRWALKPIFINYLLENNFQQIIYADPDIFFCGDYSFLFEQLEKSPVLLTPHWRDTNPLVDEENFLALFKDGLYNAGFIGVSAKGKTAMKWWSGLCQYKIEKNESKGLFVDQRYLDAMPLEFAEVEIIRHRGCNLSYWNINSCKRETQNGQLLINGTYEPVFIHFTKDTIINILNKNDNLLRPYLEAYEKLLQKENVDIKEFLQQVGYKKYATPLYSLKHKIRLRTRIKRFFFKIAEKL